jgi:hypothetical protein
MQEAPTRSDPYRRRQISVFCLWGRLLCDDKGPGYPTTSHLIALLKAESTSQRLCIAKTPFKDSSSVNAPDRQDCSRPQTTIAPTTLHEKSTIKYRTPCCTPALLPPRASPIAPHRRHSLSPLHRILVKPPLQTLNPEHCATKNSSASMQRQRGSCGMLTVGIRRFDWLSGSSIGEERKAKVSIWGNVKGLGYVHVVGAVVRDKL